ncbi:response regulator transcription factor [Hyunsoonleella flava]|uniref:Response regulator transcription factor n=1 Tax=Hyunsoonleella flava TaxID=2527939 RepID=A0A4Q9FHG9_9FLAO|nr:response regulator transcription factor [Hyunsoonleella flava]TBN06372.1 response regulator transcription factor [Hyunsoonleella flava]
MSQNIVIIEDNAPLAKGYKKIIDKTYDFKVVALYDNCEDAIENLKHDMPRVVLMDIELPKMNGVEGTKKIKQLNPKTDVIIVTVYENSKTVFEALCAGASGYITKNTSQQQLTSALNEVIRGGAPMSINIAKMVVQSFRKSTNSILSERETEVLTLLASGKSYNSVAETLFISINTIRFHIKNIYEKLQVCTREEAIEKANRERLI